MRIFSSDPNYTEPLLKSTAVQRLTTFSEFGVFKLLDRLKPTATGLDKLPAWFLRLGALFCQTARQSIQPIDTRKHSSDPVEGGGYIKPIQKIPALTLPSDYRPISITPVLARTMAKMVVKTSIYPATPWLIHSQISNSRISTHSSQLVQRLQRSSICSRHNREATIESYVIVVALDFSKAFDTVRHASVTEKTAMLKMPCRV